MFTANLNLSFWHHLANLCCVVDLKSSHGLLPNPVASCCFRFCCIILRSSGVMRHCHDACHSSVLKNYATLLVCRFQCDRSVSPHGWHVSRTWRRGMPHSIAMRLSWILESLTIHHGSLGVDSLHVRLVTRLLLDALLSVRLPWMAWRSCEKA